MTTTLAPCQSGWNSVPFEDNMLYKICSRSGEVSPMAELHELPVLSVQSARRLAINAVQNSPEFDRNVFKISDTLGSGSFSVVFSAVDVNGRQLAIKRAAWKLDQQLNLENELTAGLYLRHDNIVRLLDVYSERKYIYMIMERCPGIDLLDYLEKVDYRVERRVARSIFKQILGALEYAHMHGFSHRDIKLENIVYDEQSDHATLIDWGLCFPFDSQTRRFSDEHCGSLDYAAPEVITREKRVDTCAADLWSMAIVLHVLLTGNLPFNREKRNASVLAGGRGEGTFGAILDYCPRECVDLLAGMLAVQPSRRWVINQCRAHWWVGAPLKKASLPSRKALLTQLPLSASSAASPMSGLSGSVSPGTASP